MADIKAAARGELTIDTIKLLIRYDIPTLILGVSSIGKSYTIIALAQKFRIHNQMLYIGSEKPENIEGLPKLHSEGTVLDYFKPYWFPNSVRISENVKHGDHLFHEYVEKYYSGNPKFSYSYRVLNALLEAFSNEIWEQDEISKEIELKDFKYTTGDLLNRQPYKVERQIPTKEQLDKGDYYRDDLRDICMYLCTLMGYGNFWLVLDEIDKVEEMDIDKYAPLLHIVRERTLKGWTLVEINDGKGINIPELVKGGKYDKVKAIIDIAIKNNQSLLDTRVISIANDTSNIEEALFRRFVQIVVQDVLILDKNKITASQANLRACFEEKELMGNVLESPPLQLLNEVNLQWAFNFFNKMVNKDDMQGNFLINDAIAAMAENKEPKGSAEYMAVQLEKMRTTALWKIITNNFSGADIQQNILSCLTAMIIPTEGVAKVSGEDELTTRARKHITQLMADSENDIVKVKDEVLNFLDEVYPKTSTAADAKTIKAASVQDWINTCYSYLSATIYDENGQVDKSQSIISITQLLIPNIQHLIIKKMTFDKDMNPDSVSAAMIHAGKWWEKRSDIYGQLSGDPEEVKKVLYDDKFPFYGKKYSEKPLKEAKDPDSLLMKEMFNNAKSGVLSLFTGKITEAQLVDDEGLYNYLKDYMKDYLLKSIVPALKGKKTKAHDAIADKIIRLFPE